jgi:hypothetical protein
VEHFKRIMRSPQSLIQKSQQDLIQVPKPKTQSSRCRE